MANYCSTCRTNYFHVLDEDAYKRLFKGLYSDESEVHDFTKIDEDGRTVHGFGAYSSISFVETPSLAINGVDAYDENENLIPPEDVDNYDEVWNKDGDLIYSKYATDENFDYFLEKMQELIPEDECFVYLESGNEKLRYVVGVAICVFKNEIRDVSLSQFVNDSVKAVLGDGHKTQIEY